MQQLLVMNYKLFFLLLLPFVLNAQQRGVKPLPENNAHLSSGNAKQSPSTYAVVIGISDYQDPGIPDLKYADKDAEAFANFLRSPAGGSLDGDHLKLMTNKDATTAQFDAALGWLMDESKEGDQAIIYFSGHGDVETKTRSQQGFLLCWDSPPQAYVSGAYPIFFLKEVVSTLSLVNKVKVVLITDACRSGKLAGNSIGGSQLTSQNLAQQFSNEIKILSCQSNEYSIEGEQWGGGRGAFSYYLVDGLFGMADGNNDASVNLMEIGRYLEDHVTREVAPQNQVPMTVGNRTEKLTTVIPDLLAQIRKSKSGALPVFSPIDSRGIEEDVLANIDTMLKEVYHNFKKALKEKVFLEPIGACADAYYERLIVEPKMERLHNAMRRNYAAALQDDAQRFLNSLLKEDMWTNYYSSNTKVLKYSNTPRHLEKAANLLGTSHYMFNILMARKYLFEGYLSFWNRSSSNNRNGIHTIENLRKSLQYQPNSAIVFNLMSGAFNSLAHDNDSAVFYAIKAIEQLPNWWRPYAKLSYAIKDSIQLLLITELLKENPKLDPSLHSVEKLLSEYYFLKWEKDNHINTQAETHFKQLIKLEPSYMRSYWLLGYYYEKINNFDEAEKLFMKDSTSERLLDALGDLYAKTKEYDKCEVVNQKMLSLDSTSSLAWNNIGWTYCWQKKYAEAEFAFLKAVNRDTFFEIGWKGLASVYTKTKRYAEAESIYKRITRFTPYDNFYWLDFGRLYMAKLQFTEAKIAILKSISLDSTELSSLKALGELYLLTNQYSEAEYVFKKIITYDANDSPAQRLLGALYLKTNRPEEARRQFLKAIELYPNAQLASQGLAVIAFMEGKTTEAISYVEQAIGKGSTFEQLEKDEDLAPLRSTPEYKQLMKKHFPEQIMEK